MYEEAKKIFIDYMGSSYLMAREGVLDLYKSFNVPSEVESAWIGERIILYKDMLNKEKNMKEIACTFERLGNYVTRSKDVSALEFLYVFIEDRKEEFDSNTMVRCVNKLLNCERDIKNYYIHLLMNNNLIMCEKAKQNLDLLNKRSFSKRCIAILKEHMDKCFFISNDYMENGVFPWYMTIERVKQSMESTIKYYDK